MNVDCVSSLLELTISSSSESVDVFRITLSSFLDEGQFEAVWNSSDISEYSWSNPEINNDDNRYFDISSEAMNALSQRCQEWKGLPSEIYNG